MRLNDSDITAADSISMIEIRGLSVSDGLVMALEGSLNHGTISLVMHNSAWGNGAICNHKATGPGWWEFLWTDSTASKINSSVFVIAPLKSSVYLVVFVHFI